VWAGRINMQAGRHLLAVEYDTDATAATLRSRCERWLTDDEREVAAAFGVRTAKVGFRRRTVAILHHGAPIRARLASRDEAVDTLAAFLGELDVLDQLVHDRPGDVAVDSRAFVRSGRLVLVHAPLTLDIDDRRLRRSGIEEVPTWRPLVVPSTGTVRIGSGAWPLHGALVVGHGALDLDEARRHVWSLGAPSEVGWAELIDSLGDRVEATNEDVPEALDQLLDRRAD
jgi:hypothetical protein